MMTVKLISAAVLLFVAAAIVRQAIIDWRATPPDLRDEFGEIVALGANSATKAWLRLVGLIASGLAALGWVSEAANLPQVQDAMQKYLSPEIVLTATVLAALIGIWARNRTSDSKTIF